MDDNIEKYYKAWDESCSAFNGDKALFWAGKMSILIEMLKIIHIARFSHVFELLSYCQMNYDSIIFNRDNDRDKDRDKEK